MKIWKIVPAAPEHIPAIAADMREADRREVRASHRHTPAEALERSLERSELAWTGLIEGVPSVMWGVGRAGSMMTLSGVPWMLGTDAIHSVSRDFLRQSRVYVEIMQERFPRLENYVHAKNRLSIRWLKWCGFTVEADVPEVINGEDFYLFWRGGQCADQ